MKFIHLSFYFIIFFCSFQKNNGVMGLSTVLAYNNNFLLSNIDNLNEFRIKSQSNSLYLYENDTLKQTVEISQLSDKEIHFKFISENKYRKQTFMIEGVALNKYDGIEIDEDEEGNAYPMLEYIYNGDCWLAFRIDLKARKYLRIKQADCKRYNVFCPLNSIEFLIKQ